MPDQHRRPPWGEGPPPWMRDRGWGGPPARGFRRGVLGVLLFVVLLVAALASLVASVLTGNPRPRITLAVSAVVVIGLVLSLRWLWRNARGVAALMEAADRVAGGDHEARVPTPEARSLRRLTGSFNEMTERLQLNERRRRELLADVAHELRTPLQVVRGSIEGMLDGLYPADPQQLRALLSETLVMARLLDDLRTLSMAEEGVLPLHREAVDPRAVAEDAAAALRTSAVEGGVELVVEVAGPVPSLEADPVRVAEVLTNLLTNAIRHTPRDGRVELRVSGDRSSIVFEVDDSGPGIPVEQLPYVFDRFVRAADTGGTGLGLAIAKRLVEAHGGTIVADRASTDGTRIRFTIPI